MSNRRGRRGRRAILQIQFTRQQVGRTTFGRRHCLGNRSLQFFVCLGRKLHFPLFDGRRKVTKLTQVNLGHTCLRFRCCSFHGRQPFVHATRQLCKRCSTGRLQRLQFSLEQL